MENGGKWNECSIIILVILWEMIYLFLLACLKIILVSFIYFFLFYK